MKKNYSYSHLAMVQVNNELFANVELELPAFARVSKIYTPAFIADVKVAIAEAFGALGVDTLMLKNESRLALVTKRTTFRKLLSTVVTSAKCTFTDEPEKLDLILKSLEYSRFAKLESDESTMELALNVQGSLVSQAALYEAAQIPDALLNELRAAVTDYMNAFKAQNSRIKRATSVSAETQEKLNRLYSIGLNVSTLAQNIFSSDKSKLKLFTFSTVARNYSGNSRRKKSAITADTSSAEDFAQSIADAIAPIIEDKVEQEMLIVNGH